MQPLKATFELMVVMLTCLDNSLYGILPFRNSTKDLSIKQIVLPESISMGKDIPLMCPKTHGNVQLLSKVVYMLSMRVSLSFSVCVCVVAKLLSGNVKFGEGRVPVSSTFADRLNFHYCD